MKKLSVFMMALSLVLMTCGMGYADDESFDRGAAGGGGRCGPLCRGGNATFPDGNVGIGTVRPSYNLDINGSGYVTERILSTDSGAELFLEGGGSENYISSDDPLAFYVNSNTCMVIDENANVGIGTENPSQNLEVIGNIRATGWISIGLGGGAFLVPGGGALGAAYGFEDDTDTGVFSPGADQYAVTTGGSERVRVDASGNVGIGTESPSYKLHVNGTAAGTSWINLSAREYKDNIKKIDGPHHQLMLAQLMGVDLSTFRYKKEFGSDDSTKIGFIAEDLPKEVLSKDGKGVDMYQLLAYTIGAMKAQQKKIEILEARLNELQ